MCDTGCADIIMMGMSESMNEDMNDGMGNRRAAHGAMLDLYCSKDDNGYCFVQISAYEEPPTGDLSAEELEVGLPPAVFSMSAGSTDGALAAAGLRRLWSHGGNDAVGHG